MHGFKRWTTAAPLVLTVLWSFGSNAWGQSKDHDRDAELDRRRLIGKAYYENDKFTEAADEFRRCIKLAPDSATDHFNLALVLMRAAKYEESLAALEKARRLDPNLLAAYYAEGITYKRLEKYDQAIESLQHVIKHDPHWMGAHYNLGVCYKFQQEYQKAIEAFQGAVEAAPEHPSSHYQLITLYRRLGQVDNATRHREVFDRVKGTIGESEKTQEALERSKYSYIIEAPRLTKDLKPQPPGQVRFTDITLSSGVTVPFQAPPLQRPTDQDVSKGDYADRWRNFRTWSAGGAVSLHDYDRDGDLDIYVVNCSPDSKASTNRLWNNDGAGRFTDVTDSAGVGDAGLGMDAVFGDFDNDGTADLYVVNYGPNVLYRNSGNGCFEDVSASARVDEPHFGRTAIFVDYPATVKSINRSSVS